MDDLVVREGLYYEKFTNVPFTGEIDEGWERGPIKKGKPHGYWEYYDQDGQLLAKFHLSKGKREGSYVSFHSDGNVWRQGNYKDDQRNGFWVHYWHGGQLQSKGHFKDDKKVGYWVGFMADGTIWRNGTGTFKNGVKVSD